MAHPTYQEQWQKITSAYLNDKLNPYDGCACFVGNLLNGNDRWWRIRSLTSDPRSFDVECDISREAIPQFMKVLEIENSTFYSPFDILALEQNFLQLVNRGLYGEIVEEYLYEAMISTLEMLRQIHIAKGENVDEIPLQKRELITH